MNTHSTVGAARAMAAQCPKLIEAAIFMIASIVKVVEAGEGRCSHSKLCHFLLLDIGPVAEKTH
jgi:hypothetical protein